MFGATTNGKMSGALRAEPFCRRARRHQHRLPRADPGTAAYAQRADHYRSGDPAGWWTAPTCRPPSGPRSCGAACRSGQKRRSTQRPDWWSTTGPFNLTADYFRVDVSDRLALSQTFTLTDDERALLLSEGITSAGTLAFFPVLHQRLRDADAGDRRRFHLYAARSRGRHGPQLHVQLHRHAGDGGIRPARPG